MLSLGSVRPTFIINSATRTHGTVSNFQHNVDIDTSIKQKFDSVILVDCSIPKSYYDVISQFNTFDLEEDSVRTTITLQPGNYNRDNLVILMKKHLDTASALLGNNWIYTVTMPNIASEVSTNKITFRVTGNTSQPTFHFDGDRLHELLGFDQNTSHTFVGDSLTSANCISLQHTQYLTLKSNIAHNTGNSSSDSFILGRIYVDEKIKDNDTIIYTVDDKEYAARTLNANKSASYSFQLVDDHDREVDLNGRDFSFSIYLYTHNNTDELVAESIKITHIEKLDKLAKLTE